MRGWWAVALIAKSARAQLPLRLTRAIISLVGRHAEIIVRRRREHGWEGSHVRVRDSNIAPCSAPHSSKMKAKTGNGSSIETQRMAWQWRQHGSAQQQQQLTNYRAGSSGSSQRHGARRQQLMAAKAIMAAKRNVS